MISDSRLKRLALWTAAGFLLIVGMLLNVAQMYLMAVTLSLIPLVFWGVGTIVQRGLVVERILPQSCNQGELFTVELTLTNTGPLPKFYLRASDRLPRWMRFAGDGKEGSLILMLWPQEESRICYQLEPLKRGLQVIGPTRVQTNDLIGLTSFSRNVNTAEEILVLPEVVPIRPEFLSGGAAQGWRDQENAPTRGAGTDFHGVREYRNGDDLRRVNWKTTARTGSLAVTEYSLGYANDVTIVLDLAASGYEKSGEGNDSALEVGIKLAASIAVAALRQGSMVRVASNAPLNGLDLPVQGDEQSSVILEALAQAEPGDVEPVESTLDAIGIDGQDQAVLVCITPRKFDDPEIQAGLNTWRRLHPHAKPLMFWLQGDAFQKAWDSRHQLKVERGSDETRSDQDFTSHNYFIGPKASLIALLSGS